VRNLTNEVYAEFAHVAGLLSGYAAHLELAVQTQVLNLTRSLVGAAAGSAAIGRSFDFDFKIKIKRSQPAAAPTESDFKTGETFSATPSAPTPATPPDAPS
jgi:hypothetical protein